MTTAPTVRIWFITDTLRYRAEFEDADGTLLDSKYLTVSEAEGLEELVGLNMNKTYKEECFVLLARIDRDNPFYDEDDVTYLEQMLRKHSKV